MSAPVITAEVMVGALLVVGLLLLFLVLRRRRIEHGHTLVLCAIRSSSSQRWRLGMLRFGGPQLGWYSIAGPSMRPVLEWQRRELDITAPESVDEQIPGLADGAVSVLVTRAEVVRRADLPQPSGPAGERWHLAMSAAAYLAMRAWLESSPPGPSAQLL